MNWRNLVFTLLVAFSLLLAGCGGGGGSSVAILRYGTDWTNRNASGEITGLSQRVSVYDSDGILVSSQIVNQDVDGKQSLDFEALPTGTYRLFVELYSQSNLGGIKTGEIDTELRVQGTTVFESGVGDAVTSVKVVPDTATIKVQGARKFYAIGLSGSRATFIAPSSVTWSSLGGVADVNSEGIAVGTVAGTGSIRATHVPTSLLGTSPITVTPLLVSTTKWTVLVFLNAANDLSLFDEANVNQMERVASNPNVRFVLQWKQARGSFDSNPSFQGTRRYLVKPDQTTAINSELIADLGSGVDMGRAATLTEFLNWGRTYYPADRYVVIIWNHGNGWKRGPDDFFPTRGVSYDDETGHSIETWQLNSALGAFKWDIVGWDASLMQMAEVAYEIKDRASFIVGSEESPPGEGYPYDLIFAKFRDNPDETTRELTKAFVDGMNNDPRYTGRKITQSSLDTSKLGAVATAVSGLADALIANKNNSAIISLIPQIRLTAQTYSQSTGRTYRDLVDVCLKLEADPNLPGDVFLASQAVRVAVADAIVYERHNSNSARSNGISIDFNSAATFPSLSSDYSLLRFAADTSWNEWLTVAP